MLPVYLILRTSKKHAILNFAKPSRCVSEGEGSGGEGSGGEGREDVERRGSLRFLVLCALVRAYYTAVPPRVGATE